MNRHAALSGVMRWSSNLSRTGALVTGEQDLLVTGIGPHEAIGHQGEQPSPGSGDSRPLSSEAERVHLVVVGHRSDAAKASRAAIPEAPVDSSTIAARAGLAGGHSGRGEPSKSGKLVVRP